MEASTVFGILFWKQWKSEYFSTLQQRRKWTVEKQKIKVGDIGDMLLKDALAHTNDWLWKKIVKTFEGKYDNVRKPEVKL